MENDNKGGKGPKKIVDKTSLWRKLPAPTGRPRKFETPYDLWVAACEYFEFIDANPLKKAEWKEGALRRIPVKRPYTITGLQLYLNVGAGYFNQFGKQKEDEAENGESFSAVIERLKEICTAQKFEGAASGFFNANIISRDLGLADKKELNANVNLSDLPIEFE